MIFPGDKNFAFSIFDDTDNSTVLNTRPVYDLLNECGIKSTKSVWVYPSRGKYGGDSLSDPNYAEFIRELKKNGFEIGLHNVGDGYFSRAEILAGIEEFNNILGHYPRIHANHVSNPDNLYWWDQRFEWPINSLYKVWRRGRIGGQDPNSDQFWGDAAKQHLRYIRNLTFNGINTWSYDPKMPYRINKKKYANLWFSSSDGHTVNEFTNLISRSNVAKLERERGVCIVYTHFASGFVENGQVVPEFAARIRHLADRGGWYVPVSQLLDHLAIGQSNEDPGYAYRFALNVRWLFDRFGKRLRYNR